MRRRLVIALAGLVAVAAAGLAATAAYLPVNLPILRLVFGGRAGFADDASISARLTVADGYRIALYAVGLGDARLMQIAPGGELLVSVPDEGVVRLVEPDRNGDGRADGVRTVVAGLRRPHGLLLEGSRLVVAEVDKLTTVTFAAGWRETGRRTLFAGLPADGGHSTRTVARGPDGALYVSVGSSCNACVEGSPWRAAILRLAEGASEPEVFATGLRNTVGFDWQPGTGALYGVDNGRDLLGDDFPPDELNRIEAGGFYGWPYYHGSNVPDPDLSDGPRSPVPPVHAFGAHVAPLSIRFMRHQTDPAMAGTALVAQHGSWNSSVKVGYRIVALRWGSDGAIAETAFVTGFEKDGDVIGRPVDIVEAADGTIFISDDFAGAIYRLTPAAG